MSVHSLPEPTPDPFVSFAQALIDMITGVAIGAAGDMTVGELLEAVKDVPVKDVITALLNEEEDVA